MNIKKIVADLLCSPIIGKVLVILFNKRIPCLRYPNFRFLVPVKYSNATIHASIFWGIYESAEIRLIKKYLNPDLPVIELGGSLGVNSSFIVNKLNKNSFLTIVEANPYLISNIRRNVEHYNKNEIYFEIINKAIGYSSTFLNMKISNDNTASHVSSRNTVDETIEIQSVRLSDIVPDQHFTLVCDIEGSEVEVILFEKLIMKRCKQLFIELHDSSYENEVYSRERLLKILLTDGFDLRKQDGNVYFFERS